MFLVANIKIYKMSCPNLFSLILTPRCNEFHLTASSVYCLLILSMI